MAVNKRYSKEEKLEIIKMLESGTSISEIIRSKGVAKSTIFKWKSEFSEGVEWQNVPTVKERQLEKENEYYKKKVAELTRDVDLLKKVQEKVLQQRKSLNGLVITGGNWVQKKEPVK
jgi:transposase-like protein